MKADWVNFLLNTQLTEEAEKRLLKEGYLDNSHLQALDDMVTFERHYKENSEIVLKSPDSDGMKTNNVTLRNIRILPIDEASKRVFLHFLF